MDGTAWAPFLVSLGLLRAPMVVEDQKEHVVGLVQNQEEELDTHGDSHFLDVVPRGAFLPSSSDGAEAYSFPGQSWTLHLIRFYFLQAFRECFIT